jgi:uncharacterized protein YuzE
MTPYLEISFRHGKPFAAYIHCGAATSAATTQDLGHGLLLDTAVDGHVIGVEITDPRHVNAEEVCRILGEHGVVVPVDDLAPLAA